MSKAVEKTCQVCETPFLARRDAKTCSPTCRKRLERQAKRSLLETKIDQVKDEARQVETDIQQGLQRLAAGLLPEQVAYAGAEGLDVGSSLADEVAADSGFNELPELDGPRAITVTGDNSEAQMIQPTVVQGGGGAGKVEASAIGAGLFAEAEVTDKTPVVMSATPKPRPKPTKQPDSRPHRAFHTLRWAALALLLLLGAGVLISLMWGRNNHNQIGQLNNIQRNQHSQVLHQQTTINNRITRLEVKVNALDAKVNNLQVASTSTGTNSSTNTPLGSNVTLAGNSFNGPNQLVQLTANGLLPAVNGSNLTAVNAMTLQGNPASYYTNASNLASGTVSDSRLSNNVALLNAANTFTAPNTFASTLVLETLGAMGGSAICLNGSNQLSACGAAPGTSTLQQTYQASVSPQIVLNSSQGGLIIQDAASAIGGNLFAVQSHNGGTTYFAVTASGVTVGGTLGATNFTGNGSGLTNLNGANLTAGSVANAALANSSLTITPGTGLTGGGLVSLGGSSAGLNVAYGAIANTAVQGNTTLNCPAITGTNLTGGGGAVTLGTNNSSCNSIGFTNSPTFTGTLAVQGAGGLTVGSTANTGVLKLLDGTNDGFNASLGLSGVLGASQSFTLPSSGGTLCTTTTCAAGSGSTYVQLQGSTPGTAQTGNLNITGTAIAGALNISNAATVGNGLTVTTGGLTVQGGGLAVTGNSSITGTLGSLTGLSSSGTVTFSGLGSGVVQAASGVLSTGNVALGTQTSGDYVADLGSLTGLTTTGNSGAGSTPTLAVAYGATANTAVQGNTTLNCPTITGTNLTGGGGTVTLGTTGSSCNSLGFTNSPTFSGTLAVQGANALTLGAANTNTGAILFQGSGGSGALTLLGPAIPTTNTLTLPNETGTLCSTGSVCTGYAPVSGSGNYIDNQTSQQTANFNISGSGTIGTNATVTGNLTVNGSGNGTTTTGALFQNTTNSATAFGVQSAAGSNNTDTLLNLGTVYNAANLVTNGSFEQNTTPWTATTNAAISTIGSVSAPFGSQAMSITTSGSPVAGNGAEYAMSTSNLLPSTSYSLSFYARVPSGSFSTMSAGYSATGASNTNCITAGAVSIVWLRFNCTFTTAASISGSPYIFIAQNDTTARTWYVDGVSFEQIGVSAYYSEGTLNLNGLALGPTLIQPAVNSNQAFVVANANGNAGLTVDTNGGVLTSGFATTITSTATLTSTSTSELLVRNATSLAPLFKLDTSTINNIDTNGSFESSATTASGYTNNHAGATITVDTTANNAYEGANTGLEAVTTSAIANSGVKYALTTATFPINSSPGYSLSFYAKLVAGQSAFTTLVAGRAENGATETGCTLNSTTVTTYWQRYTCTFTTSASSGTPYVYIGQSDAGVAHSYYLDGVQLTPNVVANTNYKEGGIQMNGVITSPTIFQPQSDSTNAFQIQNSGNTTTLLNADTATTKLSVSGQLAVTGGLNTAGLSTPATPTATPTGGSGTNYTYAVSALNANGGETLISTTAVASNASTLDGTHFNTITWASVPGASSYNIYRTASAGTPSSTGKIGNVLATSALTFPDTGVAASGSSATVDTSGQLLATGTSLFKNTSATAFQLQSGGGTTLLTGDTSGMVLTVSGTTTTFASLTLSNSHFKSTQNNPPTAGTPTNCGTGTGPTAAVQTNSTDSAGSFRITAGTTGSPTTCDTVISFNKAYGGGAAAPKSIIVIPETTDGGTGTAAARQIYVSTANTNGSSFTVKFNSSPANSEVNWFYYWVVE